MPVLADDPDRDVEAVRAAALGHDHQAGSGSGAEKWVPPAGLMSDQPRHEGGVDGACMAGLSAWVPIMVARPAASSPATIRRAASWSSAGVAAAPGRVSTSIPPTMTSPSRCSCDGAPGTGVTAPVGTGTP